jgi:hypothetical protein
MVTLFFQILTYSFVFISLIFVALGVKTYLSLRRKWKIEEIAGVPSSKPVSRFLKIREDAVAQVVNRSREEGIKIDELIEGARKVDLSMLGGVTIKKDFNSWEKILKNEHAKIRFLLANPSDDEHICSLIARFDSVVVGNRDKLRADLRDVTRFLRFVQKEYPGKLEFKFYNIVPPFGIFAVDPDEDWGKLKVEIYTYRAELGERPNFILKKETDDKWYKLFREQFEKQWDDALDYNQIKYCFESGQTNE